MQPCCDTLSEIRHVENVGEPHNITPRRKMSSGKVGIEGSRNLTCREVKHGASTRTRIEMHAAPPRSHCAPYRSRSRPPIRRFQLDQNRKMACIVIAAPEASFQLPGKVICATCSQSDQNMLDLAAIYEEGSSNQGEIRMTSSAVMLCVGGSKVA